MNLVNNPNKKRSADQPLKRDSVEIFELLLGHVHFFGTRKEGYGYPRKLFGENRSSE